MAPAPEALLLLLDAAVTDDDALMRCLIRRFPPMAKRAADLTNAERDSICASPYTNHFYTCAGKYGLIIEDRPTARALVKECNLKEHIFWGGSTDPVQFATIADIVDCMHKTSPKDSLLTLMDSETNDESHRRKKPRQSCAPLPCNNEVANDDDQPCSSDEEDPSVGSPKFPMYNPTDPSYSPTDSPTHSPKSPMYNPTDPCYSPTHSPTHSPKSPAYRPTDPSYS
tara:strand:- start:1346 stop:2023 length:678 start_codon:yes stop_codon:yes gene_type:complete